MTISLIRLVAEKYYFKLKIMGQGDNQMLLLEFPEAYPDELMILQNHNFLPDLVLHLNLKRLGFPDNFISMESIQY